MTITLPRPTSAIPDTRIYERRESVVRSYARAMPRQFLGHRTAHHIPQRERKLLADLVDQAVGQALEHRRQAFAQAELQQPVDLALHVAEHLQHDLLLQIGRQRCGHGWRAVAGDPPTRCQGIG